jgi:hypothetical protein
MILSRKEFCDKIIFIADKGAVYIYMTMNGLWATDGQAYSADKNVDKCESIICVVKYYREPETNKIRCKTRTQSDSKINFVPNWLISKFIPKSLKEFYAI